jgi:hypothetical protein
LDKNEINDKRENLKLNDDTFLILLTKEDIRLDKIDKNKKGA